MAFVLDASVAASWAFDDDVFEVAISVLSRLRIEPAWVPTLWRFEVRNSLVMNERRKRISQPVTSRFLTRLAELAVSTDRSPDETILLDLARRHRLTVYDAAYLELALRKSIPVATLDAGLARASRAEGVALVA
jgi:predicted nucleic acid-binding protein